MGLSEELLVKVETMSITGDVFMFLRSGDFEELGFDCAEATTLEEAALYIFQSYKALTVKGGDVLVSHPEERIWECPEPPHAFLCIITLNVMTDPVKASDGQVYERKAIEKWMETSKCEQSFLSYEHLSSYRIQLTMQTLLP